MTIKKQNKNLVGDAPETGTDETDELQQLMLRQQDRKGLSEAELIRLIRLQEAKAHTARQTPLLERMENRKGFMNFWYLKVPMRVLNVRSISDNQKFITDTLRTMRSPQCPICNKGILMHNLTEIPQDGKVLWFCSNQKTCMFGVMAEPSSKVLDMGGIEDVLQESVHVLGRNRWAALSEEEKEELIESHLFKGVLYRNFSIALIVILLIQCMFHLWVSVLMVGGLTALTALLSLKWCYRAWQIKTGNVYPQQSLFLEWVRTAHRYYSLDWVGQDAGEEND